MPSIKSCLLSMYAELTLATFFTAPIIYFSWNSCPHFFSVSHFYFPASGQAVVTGVVPSSPRFLPSIIIAHRVQQSHCSSIFHRVSLTHALAFSASKSICAQEKVPANLYEYALRGIRTHETDLYQARG